MNNSHLLAFLSMFHRSYILALEIHRCAKTHPLSEGNENNAIKRSKRKIIPINVNG